MIDYWFFYRHRHLLNGQSQSPPQKILMISKRLPKLGFDGSWVLVNLIKGLSAHHQITLLSFTETEEEKAYVEHLSHFCKEVKTITLYPYSGELKSSFLFSKLLAIFHAFLLMRKEVLNQLKNGDYDLVHCEYVHTLNFIPNLRRLPSLLTHHEVLSLVYKRRFQQASNLARKMPLFFKWKVTEAYERRICRKVKSVVALSSVDEIYIKSKLKLDRTSILQSEWISISETHSRSGRTRECLVFLWGTSGTPTWRGYYFFRRIWRVTSQFRMSLIISRYAQRKSYGQEGQLLLIMSGP